MKNTFPFVLLMGLISLPGARAQGWLAVHWVSSAAAPLQQGQSLKKLLLQLMEQHRVNILFEERVVAGRRSRQLPGPQATPEASLEQLLAPHGLRFKKLNNGTFLIFEEPPGVENGNGRQPLQPLLPQAVPANPARQPAFETPALQQLITGTVRDAATQEPMVGVSVQVKGTSQGTLTDAAGGFRLDLPQGQGVTLLFSYVGYQPREITAGTQTVFNVELVAADNTLNEVVVVGYGTQSKSQVVGSVSQLDAEKINTRAVPQLAQGLTGQLPGVNIVQRSGQPGSGGGSIQIRGVGSFGAATNPLILVDGIPTGSFNDIDPNDVESISVLKDASSAAIYGARAANGVILVTTKMGKASTLRVSYNGYAGLQQMTAVPEYVNSREYAQLVNEALPGTYSDAQIETFGNGSDPDHYPNVNFVDLLLKKQSLQTGHNLSLSGGGENTRYLLSFGYLYQQGIVARNDYTRYNLRLNLTNDLSSRFKLTTRLSAIRSLDRQPAPPATLDFNDMTGAISQLVRTAPIYPVRLSNGDWGTGIVNKGTPVSYLTNDSFYRGNQTDIGANVRLDWQAHASLKLSLLGGATQQTDRNTRFLASQRLNASILLGPSSLIESTSSTEYQTLQAFADYQKNFGRHEVGLLAGYSFEASLFKGLGLGRLGLPNNQVTVINAGDASTQTTSGMADAWALQSYFGRLQYNFNHRYLLESTVRYDGSSRFPSSRKFAAFPSVAIGWRIGQEAFIRDHFSWVDDLKIRASYGTLGNQNILNGDGTANYYPYQNVLNTGYNYPFGGVISTGVARTVITDTTLHWESTRTREVGLDGSLFKQKLSFSATYFHKLTYDILVNPAASVAQVLGFTVGQTNSGSLINKGWEFSLNHQHKIGGLQYNIGGNLTVLQNVVKTLGVGNIQQPNGLVGNGCLLYTSPSPRD